MSLNGEIQAGRHGEVAPRRATNLQVQEALWAEVLGLAADVMKALETSVNAVNERRADLAAEVQAGEGGINRREVGIEQECLRVLALYEPVACDFRQIITAFRVNRELERIGDLAKHIAKRAKKLAKDPRELCDVVCRSLETLASKSIAQVRVGIDALARRDVGVARTLIAGDREVDGQYRRVMEDLKRAIRKDPERISTWLRLTNIARNLERAADHATNIAEEIIYLTEGVIVRHSRGALSAPPLRQSIAENPPG